MDPKVIGILKKSSLCRTMADEEISRLLDNHASAVKSYEKGDMVFRETDKPENILVLLSGSVVIAKDTLAGKRMILTQIGEPGELFGEVYVFLDKASYDMYAEAQEKTIILSLEKTIFREQENADPEIVRTIRNNLMAVFSAKAYMMNRKLRVLGSSSIREKIVRFIIDRQDKEGKVHTHLSREEMADYLNVTRPSLSRELGHMVKERILKTEGREIVVLDQEALEEYL